MAAILFHEVGFEALHSRRSQVYSPRALQKTGALRRGGRVAEGARLESVYTAKPYRGFESPSLRH